MTRCGYCTAALLDCLSAAAAAAAAVRRMWMRRRSGGHVMARNRQDVSSDDTQRSRTASDNDANENEADVTDQMTACHDDTQLTNHWARTHARTHAAATLRRVLSASSTRWPTNELITRRPQATQHAHLLIFSCRRLRHEFTAHLRHDSYRLGLMMPLTRRHFYQTDDINGCVDKTSWINIDPPDLSSTLPHCLYTISDQSLRVQKRYRYWLKHYWQFS